MCHKNCLHFSCGHAHTIPVSPCRGTVTRPYRDLSTPAPACSSCVDDIRLRMTCLCPWCARTEAYRKLRGPVEYIRTINYNSRTAATKNAVEVAEAKYDREMAVLGKMRLRQPERWERVDGVVGREKVKGGSPLRRELKAEDLEDDVGVDGDCESEDEGPSPSLMGYEPDDEDEISDVEDEDPMDSLAGKLDELTFDEKEDSPVSSAAPKEVDEPSQDSLESGAQPLCSCRSGYLCEYC